MVEYITKDEAISAIHDGFWADIREEIESALKYAELQLALSTNDTKTRCFRTIVLLLRAELSRQKNEPLTMDEINDLYEASFSGFPVWCRYIDEYSYPFGAVIDRYDGEIVAVHAAGLKDEELNREEDYGKTWLAYHYEPKGEIE